MAIQVHKAGGAGPKPLRCLVYGASRRFKTTFAATAPNPIFLSVSHEGGDRTLQVCFPHIDVLPIRSTKDMQEAVELIEREWRTRGWRTIVIDSLSFYVETFMAEAFEAKKKTNQHDWQMLELHVLKWLLITLHNLPLHVIWIALEQTVKDEATGAVIRLEPMMPGKSAIKLPAANDLVLYADQFSGRDPQGLLQTGVVLRTQPCGSAIAGGRFGSAFNEGWIQPHFAEVVRRIGPWIGEDFNQYVVNTVDTQPAAPGNGSAQPQR